MQFVRTQPVSQVANSAARERNWSSGTISVTSPVRGALWALNRWIPWSGSAPVAVPAVVCDVQIRANSQAELAAAQGRLKCDLHLDTRRG